MGLNRELSEELEMARRHLMGAQHSYISEKCGLKLLQDPISPKSDMTSIRYTNGNQYWHRGEGRGAICTLLLGM